MMQNRGIPAAINLSLAAFYGAVNLYQFFILPLWLLPAYRAWALTLLPLALLTNPFWSLIHEAIHDLFHSNRAVNACAGRLLGMMFGAPFRNDFRTGRCSVRPASPDPRVHRVIR